MNVLIIGSGGREHALTLAVSKSSLLSILFVMPGNPGTKTIAENVSVDVNNFEAVKNFCTEQNISLVIIGPEQPLVDGLSDYLRKENIKVFGPDSAAAEIESSKSFAKNLMQKYNIPTSGFAEFNDAQFDEAAAYLKNCNFPVVIKADGLAAGKGVLICNSFDEAFASLESVFIRKEFGSAGNKIIVEEFMTGEEASIFAVTDGKDFISLPSAQDHKRIGDNDVGKNTGGMGAYSPAPIITPDILNKVEEIIIKPVIEGLAKEGKKFIGCLYCGLMITGQGPKVVEFNCRFGDPETQTVLPLLSGDILKLFLSAAEEKLDKFAVKYNGGTSVCIVAASGGYPDKFEKGFEINGLNQNFDDVVIYHAGTKSNGEKIVTNGGRVLGITSVVPQNDLQLAINKAYEAIEKISYEGIYYRKDIGAKGLKYLNKN